MMSELSFTYCEFSFRKMEFSVAFPDLLCDLVICLATIIDGVGFCSLDVCD